MIKLVLFTAFIAACSAQICCNLPQECTATGQTCDESTLCYTDPRFLHICDGDPFGPWLDDGWTREGDYVYKNYQSAVNYATAQGRCAGFIGQSHGTLAAHVLRQPDVIQHIYDNQWVIGGGPATPWIGYQKLDGNWQWVDGGSTNPATTAWNAGEPNNAGGQETVAHIWRCHEPTKILMNDLSANQKKYYICEVKVL